jgi:drug/metabolite transporter (DMT)-like permease
MLGPIVLFALGETAGFLAVDIGGMVSPMAIVGPAASVGSLFTVIMARYVLKEAVRPELYLWSALVVAGIALLGVS